jgi:hypothetical protein
MEDIDIDESFLDSALGFKTLFLGGSKDITNKDELVILLNKMGFLGNVYYDFSSLNLETISARELLELALVDIREFRDNIELSSDFLPVISATEITKIAEYLADDGKSYADFIPLIQNLKFNLIKGYKDRFTVRDFVTLADLVESLVEKLYFAEVTFDQINPSRRNQKNIQVKASELVDPAYLKIPIEKQVAYLEEFNKILNSYRYYRDENGYSFYGNTIKRYATGLREIVLVKWAADLLFPHYGEYSEKHKEWVLSLDKLDGVLFEFKPVLEHFELWSDNIQTFGRNILLLADLFQEQSDGTLEINAVETAEYGSLVFMAIKTGDEILSTMIDKGYCSNMGTADSYIVSNDCYRRYFFKTIMVDLGLKSYLTKLYDYVVGTDFDEVINFLKSVEGFAREVDDGLTNLRTAKLIFGAMLNIESTLIRFDKNQDNVLDFSECEDGLSVYYGAVATLSKLEGTTFEYLVPKAYYYMIDKMKLPPEGIGGFATLTPYFLPKGIRAKRLNVGKLLENLIKKANEDLEEESSSN